MTPAAAGQSRQLRRPSALRDRVAAPSYQAQRAEGQRRGRLDRRVSADATLPEAPSSIFGSAFASAAAIVLQRSAVLRRSQPADDVGDRVRPAALTSDLAAARRRLRVDRRAGGRAAWAVRGSMSQSDLSSWILAGSFCVARRRQSRLRLRRVVQHAAVPGADACVRSRSTAAPTRAARSARSTAAIDGRRRGRRASSTAAATRTTTT